MSSPSRSEWRDELGAETTVRPVTRRVPTELLVRRAVEVDGALVEQDCAGHGASHREAVPDHLGVGGGDDDELVAVGAQNGCTIRACEPPDALDEGVHHGQEVGRRGRDDAQHLGSDRLLLQRLGDLALLS